MSDINETALLKHEEEQDQLYRERNTYQPREDLGVVLSDQEYKDTLRSINEESWRAGYDVLSEGALGDYPEE